MATASAVTLPNISITALFLTRTVNMLTTPSSSMRPTNLSKVPYVATLGERIRKRRTALGLSQAELARRVGVKREAVSQWENGASKGLKPENLLKTADVLGTTVRSLVTGHESASNALVREEPPPYATDTVRLAQAIESLPAPDRALFQGLLRRLLNAPPGTGR